MPVLLSTTNGGAVADATDNFDAAQKLLDFLTGVTGSIPVAQQWAVNRDDSVTVPGERLLWIEGPGLSATDQIHIGIRVFDDLGTTATNWELRGATGYSSFLDWDSQPGVSGPSYFTLADTVPMPFWFVANGRRFHFAFKIVNTYPVGSAGFYLPYATPSQFPYPIYCGGCSSFETQKWNTTNYRVGNVYDGPANGNIGTQVRHRDGTWYTAGSYTSSTSGSRPTTATNVDVFAVPYDANSYSSASGGDRKIADNTDGSYPVIPISLYTKLSGGNVYGEYDGLFFTAPLNNTAESVITIGGDTYISFQNMYRTSEVNMALLLE